MYQNDKTICAYCKRCRIDTCLVGSSPIPLSSVPISVSNTSSYHFLWSSVPKSFPDLQEKIKSNTDTESFTPYIYKVGADRKMTRTTTKRCLNDDHLQSVNFCRQRPTWQLSKRPGLFFIYSTMPIFSGAQKYNIYICPSWGSLVSLLFQYWMHKRHWAISGTSGICRQSSIKVQKSEAASLWNTAFET